MDLHAFVKETLTQLISGVVDAQGFAKENGARVTPFGTGKQHALTGQTIERVEFDVAVTVSEESQTGGKLGVAASFLSVGGQTQASVESSTVSRIRFSIPIAWPDDQGKG